MIKVIRQGDVILWPVTEASPKKEDVKREGQRLILAHGEVTGHAHAIMEPEVSAFFGEDGCRYLEVPKSVPGAVLSHEEHSAVTLDPGLYRVVQQREWQPEAIRPVAD